jgi:DNA-binding NtrC family response regulator
MKLKEVRILIVDDDPDVLTAVRLLLKGKVKEVVTVPNPEQIPTLLSHQPFDIILLDMNFRSALYTGNEGLFWLHKVRKQAPQTAVIMITAYAGVDIAVRALKEGAVDFIIKPWQNEKLIETLEEALNRRFPMARRGSNSVQESGRLMVGDSPLMHDISRIIEKVAPTDANILILGENGTGKDLVADAIHRKSCRANRALVKVDAGALPESLFESELFGHKKGAFTDAREERTGRFEAANGGTLFLDEIGNIGLQQQAKLLSALQNRVIYRVGENRPIPVDIRLICATNLPIHELSNELRFRKDLIYRINTVEVVLPPLRARGEDVVLLANHFLSLYTKKYLKPNLQLDPSALEKLRSYSFPGNVRELQYTMERAVIMNEGSVIKESELLFSSIEKRLERGEEEVKPSQKRLSEVEREAVEKAMERHQGNVTKAAKELGLTRTALYRRLEKYRAGNF